MQQLESACTTRHDPFGNGSGNNVDFPLGADTEEKCCRACQSRKDCVASIFYGGECQHLVNVEKILGEMTTEQCPLGVEDYPFGPQSLSTEALVFAGPCGRVN